MWLASPSKGCMKPSAKCCKHQPLPYMKRLLATILTAFCAWSAWAQTVPALEQLKADPRKAYGTDYPYGFETEPLTPAPH